MSISNFGSNSNSNSLSNDSSILDETIRKAELANYNLSRIRYLEFKPDNSHLYFNSQFDRSKIGDLLLEVKNLKLTSERLKLMLDDDVVLCFRLLEKCLWQYNDYLINYRYKIKNLYILLTIFYPSLNDYDLKQFINRYNNLVQSAPVAGAVMISKDRKYVLLVKNNLGRSWSYPKGKLIPSEPPEEGAIRECLEETGYNIRDKLKSGWVVARKYRHKMIHLYLITDVDMDFPFKPQCAQEIVDIKWFPIGDYLSSCRLFNIYINQSYEEVYKSLFADWDPKQRPNLPMPELN